MRRHLSSALEVIGLCFVAFAAYQWDWRAALAVAGVTLMFVGFALDRPGGGAT